MAPKSSKYWCFTWNNYPSRESVHVITNNPDVQKYVLGYEVGEQGTPHIQGCVMFNKRLRLTGCTKIIDKAHWDWIRGTWTQNIKYCSKGGDYVTNIHIPRSIRLIKELRPWQADLETLINEIPDQRRS